MKVSKNIQLHNHVERAVFDCLVDSDQDYDAYEELEDDFVL